MSVLTWAGMAVAGALGAVARYRLDSAVAGRFATDFPLGIFAVNLSGAFALGVLAGAAIAHGAMFIFGTGFMGGYTTFSTWMVESERLGEDGNVVLLLANLGLSMLLGLGAAALGWYLGHG